MLRDGLYLFDYPRGSIALQFRTREEGEMMKLKIYSNCPSKEEFDAFKKQKEEATKKKEEKGSFMGKIKNFFGDKN
jgi:hypothetical protein